MKTKKLLKNFALMSILIFMTGCALSRSVVPVEISEAAVNPVNGIDVKIVSVTDKRIFQVDPKTPNIPSISESEANTDAIRARAIARKRNGYGAALGDVLLPEGQSVASVMERSLSNSFRLAGFRVLKPADPNYETAKPIKVDLIKFWSWIEWGFVELKVHNKSEIRLQGPVASLENGKTISNEHIGSHAAVFESDWQDSASLGIAGLSEKVTQELQK
ncbi:hypothetical protein A9Q83_16040 [Alphaproteobacteria bacterium 46_93_T64]|nr:hypothetical protein A9Q83_16040 [Alphaproteobacteria bacterium 46_93_T64]